MTFDANTGVISGTPTKAGVYNITVTATAEGYKSASIDLALTVGAADGAIDAADNGDTVDAVAVAGLVIGIVGLLVAGAAIALVVVKKK